MGCRPYSMGCRPYSMGCRPTAPITMPRPVALATLIALFAVPFIAPHHAFADSPAADPNAAAEAPAAEQAAPEPPASAETHAAPSAPDTAAALAAPDFDTRTRLELEVLGRVNAVRAEHGLGPLQLDDRLVAAAREQAVDMAYHNYCRHTGSDGSRVRDRLRRHGYPYNNWAGENIICARRTADAAMTWWLHSAPHRANILHGHFTHIGVGVSMLGTYGPDFVLTFAAGDANTVEAGAFKALREGNVAGWIDATREPDRRPR